MRFLLRFFGEESAFGRFLNRLYVVVLSNLLFVLFSVPVVTIGASLSALDYTLMKLQRGDKHFKVAVTFWRGFRENLKRATLPFVALVLLMIFQVLEITWCRQFSGPVALFQIPLMGLMVLELIVAVYLFPVIAAFNGGIGELLKNAFYFAFSKPHRMIACVALHVAPLAATYMNLKYLPLWSLIWLLLGFGGIEYLSTKIMLPQFEPFLPEVDICGDIIKPGQEDDPNIVLADGDDSDDEGEAQTLREMMKYGL